MEQLNRIELRGIVGNVRVTDVSNSRMARMSVATCRTYAGKDGVPVVETTWHSVTALEGDGIPASTLSELTRGDAVYVSGRLRAIHYTGASGDQVCYEVVAHRLTRLDGSGFPLAESGDENTVKGFSGLKTKQIEVLLQFASSKTKQNEPK